MNKAVSAVLVAMLFGVATGCSSPQTTADEEPVVDESIEEQDEADVDKEDEAESDEKAEDKAEPGDVARAALEAAVAGEHRAQENRARDEFRNPVETLLFFGFTPEMRIVELWPGGGWYTEVLAPSVAEHGSFHAGIFAMDEDDPEDYRTNVTVNYLEWMEDHRPALGDAKTGTFDPPHTVDLGEPESADMVVTFRNLHNMYGNENLDDVLNAVHDVLKPGGVFGVVQHRAPQGSDPADTAEDGYLAESFVIEKIEEAGFVLEETSEINANPMDSADHEHGVWSLPPSLRGGEEDAERFQEIGESDRMTLRFVKAKDDSTDAGDDVVEADDGDAEAEEDGAEETAEESEEDSY